MKAQTSAIREDFQRYGFPRYEHCHMDLLTSGKDKFRALEEDIIKAKHYIHIEYYKWYNDSIGRHILDLLAKQVERGVQVRVMYDAFGCSGKAPGVSIEFLEYYRSKGIQLVGFDPMRFPYVNHALHRLHRKMVIIDGRMVYTGGLNIADYYLHGKPEIGLWADMHARLTGPIVSEYQVCLANCGIAKRANIWILRHIAPFVMRPVVDMKPLSLTESLARRVLAFVRVISHALIMPKNVCASSIPM